MIKEQDIINTIENKDTADIISIIGRYIQEIKNERPDLMKYEFDKLYQRISQGVETYQNIHDNEEHHVFVKAQLHNQNYNWGAVVKRCLRNYKTALEIVTTLIPTDEKVFFPENTTSIQEQVRTILQPLFKNSADERFNVLIDHITAKERPEYKPVLERSGTKKELYKNLNEIKKLRLAKRQRLLEVFSDPELKIGIEYHVLNKKI